MNVLSRFFELTPVFMPQKNRLFGLRTRFTWAHRAGLESSGRYIANSSYLEIELTPLGLAAEMEDSQMIDVLLRAGADPRKLEQEDVTHIMNAISKRMDLSRPVIHIEVNRIWDIGFGVGRVESS